MSLLEQFQELQASGQVELAQVKTPEALEAWRIKYLGTKGAVKAAMQRLKDAPADAKPALGQAANQLKTALQEAFDNRLAQLSAAQASPAGKRIIDLTVPGRRPTVGHLT